MSTLMAAVGRGAVAGLAGGAAMTAFQRAVEMPLTGREDSFAPAMLAEKLLGIRTRGRGRQRVNTATHVALAVGWGAVFGVAGHLGLRGSRAVGAVFAAMYPGDLALATALGIYEPTRWSRKDWAIDVGDKLVLAAATGQVFDRLAPAR